MEAAQLRKSVRDEFLKRRPGYELSPETETRLKQEV